MVLTRAGREPEYVISSYGEFVLAPRRERARLRAQRDQTPGGEDEHCIESLRV
jgi:hypothetical protein